MCKCIIAGSRDVDDEKLLEAAIKEAGFKITEVVCGMAKGVDLMGLAWAKTNGIKVKEFPADWKNITVKGAIIKDGPYGQYNAKAGIDRNIAMSLVADALIVIIKDESAGSTHIYETMKDLNKPVYVKYVG